MNRLRRHAFRIVAVLLFGSILAVAVPAAGATFANPLDQHGPDPWLQYYDGSYYLAATTWNNTITMRKSATLGGLAAGGLGCAGHGGVLLRLVQRGIIRDKEKGPRREPRAESTNGGGGGDKRSLH